MLFAGLKFIVSSDLPQNQELRTLLSEHGGEVVEDGEPQMNAVHVVDSFDEKNEMFNKLCAKRLNNIIGAFVDIQVILTVSASNCLFESVQMNKPLPKDIHLPAYSRVLEGVVFAVCNSTTEKHNIEVMLKFMGAKITEVVDESTKFLLANKVGSERYQKSVPVVRPSWAKDIWRERKLVSHVPFLLPTFHGCIISITGLSASTRSEIARLTKTFGGEYTPNLTKRCTHLLARYPQGIKYRYALEWGIHCISVDWFFDSINRQGCLDESQYYLTLSEASKKALFSPMPGELNRLSPALRRKHLMQNQSARPRTPSSRRNSRSSPTNTPPEFSCSPSLAEHFAERQGDDVFDKYISGSPMTPGFMSSSPFGVHADDQREVKEANEGEAAMEVEPDSSHMYNSLSTLIQKCDEAIAFYQTQRLDTQSMKCLEDALSRMGFSPEVRNPPVFDTSSGSLNTIRRRYSVDEVGEDESIDPLDSFEADDSDLEFATRGRRESEGHEETSNLPRSGATRSRPIPCATTKPSLRTGRREGETKL